MHLACLHTSLAAVALPTLSPTRMAMAALPAIDAAIEAAEGGAAGAHPPAARVKGPAAVAAAEAFLPWSRNAPLSAAWRAPPLRGECGGEGPLLSAGGAGADARGAGGAEGLLSVSIVAGAELSEVFRAAQPSEMGAAAGGARPPADEGAPAASVSGPPTAGGLPAALLAHGYTVAGLRLGAPSLAAAAPAAEARVHVLFAAEAGWRQVLRGYLHALFLARLAQRRRCGAVGAACARGGADAAEGRLAAQAEALAHAHGAAIVDALERQGWWVGTPLLEGARGSEARVRVVAAR